jgi:hypothetical protein
MYDLKEVAKTKKCTKTPTNLVTVVHYNITYLLRG